MSKKNRRLSLVSDTFSKPYGWDPAAAQAQIPTNAHDTWLISQAQSFLKRQDVTLEDAKALFEDVDIHTRQRKQAPVTLTWWQRIRAWIV